jgi:large exoprotein involved in heme utilization and adhesion
LAIAVFGNILIKTGSLNIIGFSPISSITNGQGNAGSVTIQATDTVTISGIGSGVSSLVAFTGVGNGSDVNIFARSLSLSDSAQVITTTIGTGNAGNIQINLDDGMSVKNGSGVQAITLGKGNAGNVVLKAGGAISFEGTASNNLPSGVSTFVGPTVLGLVGEGKGGDININARSLSLTNGAQLSASTLAKGDAGNIIIDIDENVSFDRSTASTSVEQTGVGKGGNIQISADTLVLTNGAELIATTRGQGDAGNIEINAPGSVSFSGTSPIVGASSGLFTSTLPNSTGKGGDISVNTSSLRISNGAVLDARTQNNRNGGNITLNVKLAEILNGGQILSTSSEAGNAGKITLNATDKIIINGNDSTFNERLEKFGSDSNVVDTINASSGLFVRSQSTGSAGNVELTAPQVLLNNTATISAESASGDGGNIILLVGDLLLLRRRSQISATAGTDGAGGDGGNININTPLGFIIATPNENSDIIANAFTGSGGRITVKATGIYGIAPLSREDLQRLSPDLDPSQVPTNDITAISQTNPTLSGTVELNTPEVDPNSGLVELPTIPVDSEVAQGCYSPDYAQSSFVNIGRGGLPPNPKDILTPDTTQIDWVSLKPTNNNRSLPPVTSKPTTSTPKRIVEATGATLNAKGEVVLSANPSTVTPHSYLHTPTSCGG